MQKRAAVIDYQSQVFQLFDMVHVSGWGEASAEIVLGVLELLADANDRKVYNN